MDWQEEPRQRGVHVVLGAGMVARSLARALRAAGRDVRVVHRTEGHLDLGGAEEAHADATRAGDVEDVTEGAACVYHCARPGPLEWPPGILWLARGVAEGTRRNGVDLVVLDDLSAYGRAVVVGPGTESRPCSPGGVLRAQAASLFLAPEARGRRRVIVARTADLFGPGADRAPLLGERFLRCVLSGRPAPAYGNPDLPHSYAYLPDVVRALVALGESPLAGGVYLLPAEPAESTVRVFGRFYAALGLEPALSRRSAWGAWLREFMHPGSEELAERIFQWKQPLVVDDVRIRREMGVGSTPWDEAVQGTLAWARDAFGTATRPVRRRRGIVA
ncbi:MAG: NAD-dependent epimerase/dehydratase family protein [Anaeromyxobacteraceae bacterium]